MYAILTYHTIGNYREILPAGINTPIEVFRSHMEYLSLYHYRVIPLEQMVDHIISGRKAGRKTLAITFDDGYEDHFLSAYPTLRRYGFPATIFLTAKYIDGYWESEKAEGGRIKALCREHIRKMRKDGLVRFGSHGYSHVDLTGLDRDKRVFEIENSKTYLEDLLEEDVRFLSYPFGAFDGEIKDMVRKAGYRAGFSIRNTNPDRYSIRRIPLHTRDGLMRFRFKVSPLYFATRLVLGNG
jgi:peptidoglycan/xylan/chitin deacetylase (PgdA/CDA1 family)